MLHSYDSLSSAHRPQAPAVFNARAPFEPQVDRATRISAENAFLRVMANACLCTHETPFMISAMQTHLARDSAVHGLVAFAATPICQIVELASLVVYLDLTNHWEDVYPWLRASTPSPSSASGSAAAAPVSANASSEFVAASFSSSSSSSSSSTTTSSSSSSLSSHSSTSLDDHYHNCRQWWREAVAFACREGRLRLQPMWMAGLNAVFDARRTAQASRQDDNEAAAAARRPSSVSDGGDAMEAVVDEEDDDGDVDVEGGSGGGSGGDDDQSGDASGLSDGDHGDGDDSVANSVVEDLPESDSDIQSDSGSDMDDLPAVIEPRAASANARASSANGKRGSAGASVGAGSDAAHFAAACDFAADFGRRVARRCAVLLRARVVAAHQNPINCTNESAT